MGNMLKRKVTTDTTSPTIDMASLFLLINIANHYGCNIESFDVPSAYLNCDINELIHMIIDRDTSTLLCTIDSTYLQYVREDGTILVKLKKNLYGLSDAGKKWYEYAKTHLVKLGYQQLTTDPCVFIKRNKTSFSIIGLYVDDVIYFSNHDPWRSELRNYFTKIFQVKKFNTDCISYLGLQINNNISTGITTINQIHYIKELLKKYNIPTMKASRTVKTPSTSDFFNETNKDTIN